MDEGYGSISNLKSATDLAIKLHMTDDDPIALHFKDSEEFHEQLSEAVRLHRENFDRITLKMSMPAFFLGHLRITPSDAGNWIRIEPYRGGVSHYGGKKYWRRYKRIGKS